MKRRLQIGAVLLASALAGSALPALAAERSYPFATIGGDILTAGVTTADAELRMRLQPGPDPGGEPLPVVDVLWRGAVVGEIVAEAGMGSYPAVAGLVEMDPANDTPEAFLESYTGGAHCCTEIQILTKRADETWTIVAAGQFDGGGGLVEDVDYDGRYEIVARDDAFHYAFGCYACSVAPLTIMAIEDGEMGNVAAEARFATRQRDYLKQIEEGVKLATAGNGYLAGWVAQKSLVGEGAGAWAAMLEAYDRNDDWGLRACPGGGTECPDEQQHIRPYPEALKAFLEEHGYAF